MFKKFVKLELKLHLTFSVFLIKQRFIKVSRLLTKTTKIIFFFNKYKTDLGTESQQFPVIWVDNVWIRLKNEQPAIGPGGCPCHCH